MKTLRGVLLSVLAVFLACSEDSGTGPEGDGSYVLEATETIGAAGDTVAIEDFSLVVPPGAFNNEQTLRIYASSEEKPFGGDQVTRSFRLEGLPTAYNLPLRVNIKYEGSLSGETYVARGERFFDHVNGDTITVYCLHAASDSAGHLVAELPATQEGAPRRPPGGIHPPCRTPNSAADALSLLGLKNHGKRETEHFVIHYPQDLVTVSIPSVGAMLEEMYAKTTNDLQLPWPCAGRMHALIKDIGLDRGAYCGLFVGPEGPVLNLSRTYLSDGNFTRVRVDAGEWVLGLILGSFDASALDPANFWLYSAVVAWAEEVFTDDEDYRFPARLPGKEMAPFHGMRAGAGVGSDAAAIRRAIEHGHGMSAVIKYLTDDSRFTTAGIGSTYETIEGTGCSATAALLNNVEALVAEWWPQFFKSYVGGEVYGVGKDVFTGSANLSGSWTIATGDDSVKVFTGSYPDLSAKLYMINLNYAMIDPSADLILKFTGHVGTHEPLVVMAFGVGSASLDYWGHSIAQGTTSLQVPSLKALYDAGTRQILVVAICSNVSDTYLQNTDADLEIRVRTEEEPEEPVGLEWNTGFVSLTGFQGHFKRDYFDPAVPDQYYDDRASASSILFRGSFTGGTFTGGYDYLSPSDAHYVGSVHAVLTGNPPRRIAEFEWSETKEWNSNSEITTVRLANVPFSHFGSWGQDMVMPGEACDYVVTFEQTSTYGSYSVILESWECTGSSDVDVEFRTE